MIKIPLSKPDISELEIEKVTKVLKSDALSSGNQVRLFERGFESTHSGYKALGVSSGTAALHLAIKSLGIHQEDEVITTPFSFVASTNCILYEKATPVFVDIEEDTLGMNPELISAAVSERTRAILPVHVFGQPCKIDEIKELTDYYDLHLIEDNCEGIYSRRKGKLAGTFGDVSCYGFYPNKQLTTGEGGILLTNNEKLYNTAISLRNQGRMVGDDRLIHDQLGYNYRLDELSAAVGLAQLERSEEIISRRRYVAELYNQHLSEIEEITVPGIHSDNESSWFVYVIRVNEKIRDKVVEELNRGGIQSKPYFWPCIHLQPYFKELYGDFEGGFPVAERVSREVVALPFFNSMTEKDIVLVADALKSAFVKLS